jgi:hypothetical protein
MADDRDEDMHDLVPAAGGDGFDDHGDDGDSLIRGTLIKFGNDYVWRTRGDQEVIKPDREFVIVDVLRIHQIWPTRSEAAEGKKKPVTRILAMNEPFPDVEVLNSQVPESEWRDNFGQKKGPHENAYVAYLFDLATKTIYTFISSTKGGHKCFRVLKQDVQVLRKTEGAHVYPKATLTDVWFTPNFGGKQRPHFKICGHWSPPGSTPPTVPQQPAPRIDAPKAPACAPAKPKANADMDDDIPFAPEFR